MRSRAHFKSHPLHPILIAFPIAFGAGCLIFDLAGRLGDWPSVWTTGAYLSAGTVLTGLVAAVPGLIDYFGVVPPNSSAKKRATWHMLVNVTALTLIGVGWLFRDADLRPGVATILLEAIGMGVMTCGGWMGGTLVYRNQIGVDHRYANAGKWKEEHIDGKPGESVIVASTGELEIGHMKLLHVRGRRIVLARTEAGHAAIDDRCPHRGGPLSDGVLACGVVTCPWHGSQFDVNTGARQTGPTPSGIATHSVEEGGGKVRLVIPEDTG
jgi:nitrite reductase/ring-hydroxylating ferredoxin subunit/uncharacterized membrane protein